MKVRLDRVMVKKAIVPEKVGGLFIPEATKQEGKVAFNVGKVIGFGPGVKTFNGEYIPGYDGEVGDVVTWEKFGDYEAGDVFGKNVWLIRNEDILAVLDEKEAEKWCFDENGKQEVGVDKKDESEKKVTKKCQCENRQCKALHKERTVELSKLTAELPACEFCGERMTGVIDGAPTFDAKLTPKFHT